MATTTPNMGLTVPVLNDPSPGYVTNIANTFTAIDNHDHSTGKGTPISTGGININAALPFNSYSATALRSTQFVNQASQFASTGDGLSLYAYGGDLYYLTALGVPVRVTNGASLVQPSVVTFSSITASTLTVTGATSLSSTTLGNATFTGSSNTFAGGSTISQPSGTATFGGTNTLGPTTATSLAAPSIAYSAASAAVFRYASPFPYVSLSSTLVIEQQVTGQVPWLGFRNGTVGLYIPMSRAPKTFGAGTNYFGFYYTTSATLTAAPTSALEVHSFGASNVPTRVVLAATGNNLITNPAATGVQANFTTGVRTDAQNDMYYITVTNTDTTNYLRIGMLYSQYTLAANTQVAAAV